MSAPHPATRGKRLVTLAAVPAAVLLTGGIVWQASYSAFSSTTSNPTNNWTAGTVVLTDDDANTAMFTATNLKPGSTGTKCIRVTSTGSLASNVKLYGTAFSTTKSLANNLAVTVEEGSGAGFGDCTGFTPLATGAQVFSGSLNGFGTSNTSYATGVGVWAPTGTATETRSYRIVYTLNAGTPDAAQGGTAALGFTWEAQNS